MNFSHSSYSEFYYNSFSSYCILSLRPIDFLQVGHKEIALLISSAVYRINLVFNLLLIY